MSIPASDVKAMGTVRGMSPSPINSSRAHSVT
jgi:hypothetical protein